MPSLNDIPENILDSPYSYPFINWIADLPLDKATKSTLTAIYDRRKGHRMPQEYYDAILTNRKIPK